MVLLCALLVVSGWLLLPAIAAIVHKPDSNPAVTHSLRLLVALGWAGAFVWLLAALRRNLHSFHRRPHPFLQH